MTDEVSLEFVSRQVENVLAELRAMRRDMDMLTRLVLSDLRRRVEALEEARK